ncbi:MAG: AbrB/MazE/SpoVT family DNA-binding domain-containing protein [Anaerovoracaceae bacterium]
MKEEELDFVSPKGKHIFGLVTVGERGQIVIPKDAREIFAINPGDKLLVMGDEQQGLAIVKTDALQSFASFILEAMKKKGEL